MSEINPKIEEVSVLIEQVATVALVVNRIHSLLTRFISEGSRIVEIYTETNDGAYEYICATLLLADGSTDEVILAEFIYAGDADKVFDFLETTDNINDGIITEL